MNTVAVMLRHRPGPDVLLGEVDLPDVQLYTEVVDPDVVIRWQATLEGEVLHSFQIIDASARLAAGDVPLPRYLLKELQRLAERWPRPEPSGFAVPVSELHESELVVTTSLLRRPTRRRTPALA